MASRKKGKGLAETSTNPDAAGPSGGILAGGLQNLHTNYVKCLENITKAVSSDVTFTLAEVGKRNKVILVSKGKDLTPNGAFVFELTDGESRLTIVCDKYQVWMRGIVNDNGRYELNMPGPNAMARSNSLHTTGSYPDLLGESVHICVIGFQSLLNAFHTLVAYRENTDNHKAAIAVILVMFFEASRLQELRDLIFRLIRHKDDELVGGTNRSLINGWCNTCRDFFNESGDAEGVITIAENTGAATKKVAKSVLILCRSPWDEWVKDNVRAVNPRAWKPSSSRK